MNKEKMKNIWKKVWPVGAMWLGMAVVLTILLEWRYFNGDVARTWEFMWARPKVFLYNIWLMGLIVGMLGGLMGGILRGASLTGVIVLIVGYVNGQKMAARGVPLLPEDLQLASEAGSLASFVSIGSILGLIAAIGLWLVMMGALTRATKKYHIRLHLLPRLAIFAVAMLVFMGSTSFIRHNNGEKYQWIEGLETTFTAWNQTRNYDENGFIIGFLYNWSKFKLSEPAEYSEERIAEIEERLEKRAAEDLSDALSDKSYNIVVIMNESFIDWGKIEAYYPHSGGEVTPVLRRLMTENASGYMYSVDYGGGTANVEFEAMTGLTNYWMQTVPYTSLIPKVGTVPSWASWARENGYATTAVHGYNGGMYKRNIVLPNEGFDKFITVNEYTHDEREEGSEYVNDRSTYAEVLDVLRTGKEKQFVFAVTMQNHTPYNYSDGKFRLDAAPNGDEERKQSIENYLYSLNKSDEYLGEFIASLDELEEETIVLFFGDHAPGLLWELDTANSREAVQLSRMTPYFIYGTGSTMDLPMTTPNCLMNTMVNMLSVKKPLIGYMLDEVCKEAPVLTAKYFGDDKLDESSALTDYKLWTYDILGGQRYLVTK